MSVARLRSFLSWRARGLLHALGRSLPRADGGLPSPARIILFAPGGIGDGLMFLPALETIRRCRPGNALTLVAPVATLTLARDRVADAIEFHGAGALTARIEVWRAVWGRGPFDAFLGSVHSVHGIDAHLVALASRASHRIAPIYPAEPRGVPRGLWTATAPILPDVHDVVQNLELLRGLGIGARDWMMNACIDLEGAEVHAAARWLAGRGLGGGRPLIGMHPGSEPTLAHKRWQPERFVEVARAARTRLGADVLVFEGPGEPGLGARIVAGAGEGAYLVCEPSVRVVAALIARCRAFLSSDSGLGHLASVLGIPTVTVMGPASPARVAPWADRPGVLWARLACSPCIDTGPCPDEVKPCTAAIQPGQVLAHLAALLPEGRPLAARSSPRVA